MRTFDGTKLLVQFYANHGALAQVEKKTKVSKKRLELWLNGKSELSAEDRKKIEKQIEEGY